MSGSTATERLAGECRDTARSDLDGAACAFVVCVLAARSPELVAQDSKPDMTTNG
jgi:hypothetical protein